MVSIIAEDAAGARERLRPIWEHWPCTATIEAIDDTGEVLATRRMAIAQEFGSRSIIDRGNRWLRLIGRVRWRERDPFLMAIQHGAHLRVVSFYRSIDSTDRIVIGKLLKDCDSAEEAPQD